MDDNTGKSVWFDLPVLNLSGAMAFYEGLLNWKYVQMADSPETNYVMIKAGEKLIGGMRLTPVARPLDKELSAPLLYFTVPELEPKIRRAKELGALIVGDTVDLGHERGRYQRILDREKNLIALWAPNRP